VTAVRRRYVDVAWGQLHVAECGDAAATPVVLLHQTPRSWDEYAEVLPLLARTRRAIAVDLPGMGASDPHPGGASIEAYGTGVVDAIGALGLTSCDLVGHHTGGVVAFEVATQAPPLVRRLVLSSTPYLDADAREARRHRPPIDAVDVDPGGAHLAELWQRRRRFYPPDRPDLLARFVRDALRVADAEAGHSAVAAYEMERRVGDLRAPTLLVGHAADPYAFPELDRLRAALGDTVADVAVIDGGMVPLEYTAAEFAGIVERFLSGPRYRASRLSSRSRS
jgi:pimeloyl-ACP methyl ester carboxylesterase